ncbi:hypothetical protein CRG95_18015 [Escherichia sp. E4208]|nr:hypothetical protein CRG95_18015 [Escherichia sp. E4208]
MKIAEILKKKAKNIYSITYHMIFNQKKYAFHLKNHRGRRYPTLIHKKERKPFSYKIINIKNTSTQTKHKNHT